MYHLASSFINVALVKEWIRAFFLLLASLLVLILVPKGTLNVSQDVKGCLAYYSIHPNEVQKLASMSLCISKKYEVPVELLMAILMVESYKRPISIRFFEINLLKLLIISRKIGISRLPDFSIGLPQLKLSTAFWIDSGFKNPIPLSERSEDQIRYIVNKLENPNTAVELACVYLAYITSIVRKSLLIPQESPSTLSNQVFFSRIASIYKGGISQRLEEITQYGKLVFLISKSKLVRESLEQL